MKSKKFDVSVMLINFEGFNIIFNMYYATYPPLGLAYIASVIKPIVKNVKIIDAPPLRLSMRDILEIVKKDKPRYVGLSAYTASINATGYLAREIKHINPEVVIVLGGPHVFHEYEQTMRDFPAFDYVIRGDGEYAFKELIEAIESKKGVSEIKGLVHRKGINIIANPLREIPKNLDDLPLPSYDLLPMKKYLAVRCLGGVDHFAAMITSRGCPFHCTYCESSQRWNRRIIYRSIKKVIEEAKLLQDKYNVKMIKFNDDHFTLNPNRVLEFCRLYHKNKLKFEWACLGRVDSLGPEVLKEMKKANCKLIFLGLEFGNDKIREACNKKLSKKQMSNVVKWADEVGIDTFGSFMLGYPGETLKTMKETVRQATILGLDWAGFCIVTPLPGTELMKMCKEKNLLTSFNWDDYSTKGITVIKHKNFTEKQLLNMYSYAQRKFYFRTGYIFRRLRKLKIGDFYLLLQFTKEYFKSRGIIKGMFR